MNSTNIVPTNRACPLALACLLHRGRCALCSVKPCGRVGQQRRDSSAAARGACRQNHSDRRGSSEFQKRSQKLVGDPNNDFLLGDDVFLAAYNDAKHYSNANATDHTYEMIPRFFESLTSLITNPPATRLDFGAGAA